MNDNIRKANAYNLYHEDPAFREPWEKIRAAFVTRWQTTKPGETEVRETIFRFLGLMDKLDKFVGEVIASGEIDKANFEKLVKHQKERANNPLD